MANTSEIERRVRRLEARTLIEDVMVTYMANDRTTLPGEPDPDPYPEVLALFDADAVWEGVGRSVGEFGRHEGRAAIERFLRGVREQSSSGVPFNFHLLTNGLVEIGNDGTTARGRWKILQPLTNSRGEAVWRMGKLDVSFILRGEAEWKIARFAVETVVATPFHEGWAKTLARPEAASPRSHE